MASADFSRFVVTACPCGLALETSPVMDVFFPPYTRLIYFESSEQLWDFVLFCRLIHSHKPWYQVSVRRVRCLPTASFRFHLAMDTLAFGYSLPTVRAAWGLAPVRIRSCWANNRVGGKRSSFLPTFVFRPLTPPYVPFGIRRFSNCDAIWYRCRLVKDSPVLQVPHSLWLCAESDCRLCANILCGYLPIAMPTICWCHIS